MRVHRDRHLAHRSGFALVFFLKRVRLAGLLAARMGLCLPLLAFRLLLG